ncbi:MAG: hydrogenase small subunit [Candidatus Marinimicrobia bacterium]|jgi:hydrogenase small subunit|nr:hydrogenase small subunit [Candidatus Neomarinimicrobiota bacterium]MBT4713321.1 hydrogenase small subunit [Candidatus Neomarinimicrobiota bacterium]MBT4944842.1 hydrogenase small subunit [Candidatus Neomarinimicrobiota bacterium]MBT5271678.1 hydrogenase small subunit [Candidatus Neomarinimicrobiota bacterium]MBT6010052.1 hydrogenase small subunit [Candidatus Neomarinimicrobiota bacterium]
MGKLLTSTESLEMSFSNELEAQGVSRRSFLKFCTAITAAMGLPATMVAKVADAIASPTRTPVIWLHFQECTGCTESLLRATHPTVEELVLDMISLDYSETLCAAAGHQVEKSLIDSAKLNEGKYILVVEGSIPVKEDGIYCKIADRTALDILNDYGSRAAAIVAIGSCASWGGVQSSSPNPTGATGVHEIIKDKPVINLPGCPASPYNLLSTILYYLTLGKLPQLDSKARPKFAYGRLIHEHCERRPHFDAGRFALEFGDDNHREGHCLYKLGCKGPETYNNCSSILFGDVGSGAWPVGTGHPCFGCSEEGVGFTKYIHEQADVFTDSPPASYAQISGDKPGGVSVAGAAVAGAVGGVILGASAVAAKKMKAEETAPESDA